jgi:hypothetical protein
MTTPSHQGSPPTTEHPRKPCPRCNGKGTLPVPPAGIVVIPTVCSPRAGAPPSSPDPRIIAYYLQIPSRCVWIAIKERQIWSKVVRGQRHYLLRDVQAWYDAFRELPALFYEDLLQRAYPHHSFVYDDTLGGYTIDTP